MLFRLLDFDDLFYMNMNYRDSFRTNLDETETAYVFEVVAPGLDKSDFEVETKDSKLTVKIKREEKTQNKYKYADFMKSIKLSNVDYDNVSAEYKNGILYVTLPKQKHEENKKTIKIK